MTRRMLIDAAHPEETRVTVVNGNRLEEFDYETTTKQQVKGNVYLAKVTRVEPSLQAAFVEYGGNRHGFLAFSEIHPDYYRIPISDREDLMEEVETEEEDDASEAREGVEDMGSDEDVDAAVEEVARRRPRLRRQYKIQEVIKRRQVMLIQVVKEERGTKGAALTTYLSLAGRYCVVMPNTSRGGGVSRKIANVQDRKRLKTILSELSVPDGMAVILRTAGAERSKAEVKRDFDYIMKLWDDIREKTLASTAPCLIHEEGNLIKRAIRDLYTKDIEEILVAGDEAYRIAKDFMKALTPSHAKKVQPYKDEQGVPLLHRYQVEQQLALIHAPTVQLRSGGSIVIHQTEALVAIDVNSGKSTRERHIEETALKTNLEAADEVARQLRLRDLAGLIVIDFIDMDESRNVHSVERRLKEALRRDRARIQVGRISSFGLMEMSRQRLRPSLIEAMSQPCPSCGGVGYIVSTESAALMVTRAIEEEGLRRRASEITVKMPGSVALYVLNHKRAILSDMEQRYGFQVLIEAEDGMLPPNFDIQRTGTLDPDAVPMIPDSVANDRYIESEPERAPARPQRNEGRNDNRGDNRGDGDEDSGPRKRSRRGGRRRGRRDEEPVVSESEDQTDDSAETEAIDSSQTAQTDQAGVAGQSDGSDEDRSKRRRKRGRRGGRRRNRSREEENQAEASGDESASTESADAVPGDTGAEDTGSAEPDSQAGNDNSAATLENAPATKRRRSRGPRAKAAAEAETNAAVDADAPAAASDVMADPESDAEADAPAKRPRRSRKKAAAAKPEAAEPEASVSTAPEPGSDPEPAKPARRSRKKASAAKPNAAPAEPAEPEPETTAPAIVSETVSTTAPEPAAEPEPTGAAAESDSQPVEDGPPQPKKRGWWNRVMG